MWIYTLWSYQSIIVTRQWHRKIRGVGCYKVASHMVLVVKNLPVNAGVIRDVGLISRRGRSPGGGHGNPFQYSCLENPMDRGAWRATVHRVAKSWTWLKKHHDLAHTHACRVSQKPRKISKRSWSLGRKATEWLHRWRQNVTTESGNMEVTDESFRSFRCSGENKGLYEMDWK